MSEELDIPSFLDDPEPDDAESQEEEVVEEVAEEPETEAEPDEAEPEVDLAALQARLDELEKENKGLVGAVAEQRGRRREAEDQFKNWIAEQRATKEEAKPEPPSVDEDPVGHITARLGAIEEGVQRETAQTEQAAAAQQVAQFDQLVSAKMAQEAQAAGMDQAEIQGRLDHVANSLSGTLSVLPGMDEQKLLGAVQQTLRAQAYKTLQSGGNLIESLKDLSERAGYQAPSPPPAEKKEAKPEAPAKKPPRSLSAAKKGGGSGRVISAEQLADPSQVDDATFNKIWDELRKQGKTASLMDGGEFTI